MKFDIFGRNIEILKRGTQWKVFYLGNEGKKRLAEDIIIPSDITECQLTGYLFDLCHEWIRPEHSTVERID